MKIISNEFNIDEYNEQVMNFIKNELEEKENKNTQKANNFIHCRIRIYKKIKNNLFIS